MEFFKNYSKPFKTILESLKSRHMFTADSDILIYQKCFFLMF